MLTNFPNGITSFGRVIDGNPITTPGDTYYVSRNVGASGDGTTWDKAFKTIGEAIAKVNANYTAAVLPSKGRNNVIYISEGWYSEVPLTLTANDVRIKIVAPGNHDAVVLYGSATDGGWDIGSGGPALTITGSNCTVEGLGAFTYDVLYPSIQLGAPATGTYGNELIGCSCVRDVADGSIGGVLDYGYDRSLIRDGFFSTSCKDYGVKINTDGVNNPVNSRVLNNDFVGTPIGVHQAAGHNTLIADNNFYDDTSDRPDVVDYPILIDATSAMCRNNYAMTTKADLITGAGTINDIGNWGSDSST